MNFFAQLTQQLGNIFNSQSAGRRVMALVILAGSMAGLGMIVLRASNGTYKTLYTNLRPADSADAAGKLHAMGIPTRFANDGGSLQVPSSKWDQALMVLAQEGFPSSGSIGYELMDTSSIGLSDFEQKVKFHRSLEGELARTIMAISSIERAKVHLAIPKASLFVRDKVNPTASVVLRIRAGQKLDEKEIAGITYLVAHAVEGLDPASVSILDNKGKMLNQGSETPDTAAMNERIGYKIAYENHLKDEIETMLATTIGQGKVAARVNADFDFTQKTETQEIYDPDSKVIRRENVRGDAPGEASIVDVAPREGSPGSSASLPPGVSASGATPPTVTQPKGKMDRETTYELSRTSAQTVQTAPLLKRITVSVMVDGTYTESKDAAGKVVRQYAARPPEEISVLEQSVKNIIGYSEDRPGGLADQVAVASAQFQLGEEVLAAEPLVDRLLNKDLIREIIQWSTVGLIALLLIFTVLRPAVKGVTMISAPRGAMAGLPAGERGSHLGSSGSSGASLALGGSAETAALPNGSHAGAAGLPRPDGMRSASAAYAMSEEERRLRSQPSPEAQRAKELEEEIHQITKEDFNKSSAVIRQWMEQR